MKVYHFFYNLTTKSINKQIPLFTYVTKPDISYTHHPLNIVTNIYPI